MSPIDKLALALIIAAVSIVLVICSTIFGIRYVAFHNGYEARQLQGTTECYWVKVKP